MTENTKNRHDFNNQLAIIHGFAEMLLAETAVDDPRRPDLEEIRTAAVAALALLARVYPVPSDGANDDFRSGPPTRTIPHTPRTPHT